MTDKEKGYEMTDKDWDEYILWLAKETQNEG
jgi:hypothetical protein